MRTLSPNYFNMALSVYDAGGKLVYEKALNDFNINNEIKIDVNNWSNGIYFFCINKEGKIETVKIVKSDY